MILSAALLAYHAFPGNLLGHATSKLWHFFCHIMTSAFVIAAVAIIFKHHKSYVFDIHAFLGMMTIILFGLQFFAGLSIYYIVQDISIKKWFMPLHKFFGFAVYIAAFATIFLGINIIGTGPVPVWGPKAHMGQAIMVLLFITLGMHPI